MKHRIDIIAGAGRIEAVLGAAACGLLTAGNCWRGDFGALKAHTSAGRLLGQGSLFDGELTARWGRLVGCTPEFSAWWRARPGAPVADFFLEVTA